MFKDRLKSIRKEKGISQYKLASDLHVAQSTIAGWENGNREPDFEMIKRISEYFHVTIDYLLGKSDTPSSENTSGIKVLRFGESIFEDLDKLPEEAQAKVKEYCEMIRDKYLGGDRN